MINIGNDSKDKTVTKGNSSMAFSAHQLAAMKLPRYPITPKGWYKIVKQPGWLVLNEPGKGPGGMRQVFVPPPEIMSLIDAHQRSEFPPANRSVREPAASYAVSAPDGFVLVPRYDVHGSMGNGSVIHSEQIVDHLAFRAEWVRSSLGASPEHLVLISAIGDSMEPTLRAGDLLLIDRSVTVVRHDSIYIYAFAVGDELRVKRVQRLFDGTLIVKSDNPGYASETLTPEQADKVSIVGRVVWTGRRM